MADTSSATATQRMASLWKMRKWRSLISVTTVQSSLANVKFDYTLSDEELDDLDDEEFTPHAKKVSEVSDEPEVGKKAGEKEKAEGECRHDSLPAPLPLFLLPFWASTNQSGGEVFSLLRSLSVGFWLSPRDLVTATREISAMPAVRVKSLSSRTLKMAVPSYLILRRVSSNRQRLLAVSKIRKSSFRD